VIADPALVVLTAHAAVWADDDPARTAWIIHCLNRHNQRDWGDLDADDTTANNYALRHADGEDAVIHTDIDSLRRGVRVEAGMRRGAAAVPHGFLDTNVNRITDDTHHLDPIRGRPRFSAIPITIEPAGSDPPGEPCRHQMAAKAMAG
jgi:hypothetical protein